MKTKLFIIAIFFISINIAIGAEITQRSIASEPEVESPSKKMSKEPRTPDEPQDEHEQDEIDGLEATEPDEPKLDEPYEYMDKAYDKDMNVPIEPELRDTFRAIDCPNGMQCDDPTNNLLNEPPYTPTEPYIRGRW